MTRRGAAIVAGSLVGILALVSCSEDEGNEGDGGGTAGTGGNNGDFRDVDGDGEPDPIQPEDLGGGAVPTTQAAIDAIKAQTCAGWAAEPEPLGASLFLVVDASSSMDATANGTGNRDKWSVTRDALITTVNQLPGSTTMGLLGYPNKVVDFNRIDGTQAACVNVDAMVALSALDSGGLVAMVDGLQAIQTETCTPTHDAYRVAVDAYASASAVGQKYIMLMTDGTPTLSLGCNGGQSNSCRSENGDVPAILEEIRVAREEHDIKTFVLGCPGSELHMDTGEDNRPWLSEAAVVGGTADAAGCSHTGPNYCHFDMSTEADYTAALTESLQTIASKVVSCDYSIPPPPSGQQIDPGFVNMFVWPGGGGEPLQILADADASCEQGGWYYDEAGKVRLCPSTCDVVQSDPQIRLELLFGCEGTEIIR